MKSRGITERPKVLRFVENCRTSRGEYYPAMIAIVSNAEGKAVTLHRTYLGKNGKADIENTRELMAGKLGDGAAIRLFEHAETLGIAEGIETAMCAAKKFSIPVWSCINATMLEKWSPPSSVKNVIIFGDADKTYTGQKSAYILAHKLNLAGLSVDVKIPDKLGTDWADL